MQIETYVTTQTQFEVGLKQLRDIRDKGNLTALEIAYNKYLSVHTDPDLGYQLIFLDVQNMSIYEDLDKPLDSLRTDEKGIESCEGTDGYEYIVVYDKREYTRAEGVIGISRTLFVCVVLSIGSIFFSSDANTLVLNPIERMLEKVKLIASNPLAAASDEVD